MLIMRGTNVLELTLKVILCLAFAVASICLPVKPDLFRYVL